MTDPQQYAPAPQPPAAPPYGGPDYPAQAQAHSAQTQLYPAQGQASPAPGQAYPAQGFPAQGFPAQGSPVPGYGAPAVRGYGAPPIAAARPNGAGGVATLALVFAGVAVLAGWMNTLVSVLAYRFDTPVWIFSVLGGLVIATFNVLALVFGIVAARRGSGVKGGITIGIAIVGLLGLLFSMMIPALYSTLMRL